MTFNRLKVSLTASIVLAMIASSQLAAENVREIAVRDDASIAMDLVLQDQALRSRVEMNLSSVKSRADLDRLLSNKDVRIASLAKLSRADRESFVASLKFNEKGLTEFDLSVLKKLSPSDVYQVLSLFGLQSGAGKVSQVREANDTDVMINALPKIQQTFLEGYRCVERERHAAWKVQRLAQATAEASSDMNRMRRPEAWATHASKRWKIS